MLKFYREITIGVLLIAVAFLYNRPVEVRENIEESTLDLNLSEKKTTKRRTETKKPDGEIVIVYEEIEENTKENRKETDKKEERIVKVAQTRWSLGINYTYNAQLDLYKPNVELGRRIIGPLWGTVGYQQVDKSFTVGVRMEF